MSNAETLLAVQLDQAGIPYEREFRFAPPRRWRFDFAWKFHGVALEVEGGSWSGGHKRGKAYESDCDKQNEAMLRGWEVYRVTPAMVEDGRALAVVQQALTSRLEVGG